MDRDFSGDLTRHHPASSAPTLSLLRGKLPEETVYGLEENCIFNCTLSGYIYVNKVL